MSRSAEVLRILERYLVEVVERYELCPWARAARERGELATAILWGAPSVDAWVAAAAELLARPTARVAMVIAPELVCTRAALGAVRDQVAAQLPAAGVAEFSPDAVLDLATPARLVPFLRRSPDPLLQLVPLALLEAVRGAPAAVSRAAQAGMLGGHARAPAPPLGDRIAHANHATVASAAGAISAALDDIAADRRRSYARLGISSRA